MPQSEQFTSPQQELAHLSQMAERSYVLQEHGSDTPERAAQQAIETYAQTEAREFIHETRVLAPHETEALVLKLKPEEHDRKIEELFGIMLEKGVKAALDVTSSMRDPHLQDDFHRFLVQYLHTIGAIPGLKEHAPLHHELDHILFVVTLPPHPTGENGFKHFIAAMKQFYLGMTALNPRRGEYYVLELAVAHAGRDIALYASIPRLHSDLFEKLVHAYYPDAEIEEATNDYNLFTTGSAIAGAVATLDAPALFPLALDAAFEHDPLAALIASLTKLEADGVGAAIQLVIHNDTSAQNSLISSIVSAAEKDPHSVKDLYLESTESLVTSFGKGIIGLFAKEKNFEGKEKDAHGIELAKQKSESQIVSAGIRLIAAAPTAPESDRILSTIKASFNQFAHVDSNALVWKDISTRALPDFVHNFSFRTLVEDEMLPLSVSELAILFHFPVAAGAAAGLKENPAASAPAPELAANGIKLGTNMYRGVATDIYFAPDDRMRHCYVIGQTGTGKTVFLKNMIIQDIKRGAGVCYIDPHGSDILEILAHIPPERADDVIYFDPAYTPRPVALNMLEYDPRFPEQKIFVINELLAIFNKLFDMKVAGGPMFEQYFRNAAGLVMEDPESGSTLLEIGRVLSDKAFRTLKLSRCKNPVIRQFWENAAATTGEASLANFVPYITNKFDVFISNDIMRPVIAQQHSTLNFRDIMDQKKILLVNLSKGRLGDINSHLIGLLLVGKLTMAALSRVDIVGRGAVNDFYLYIDEFQNVTTDSIAVILSEARKYRLGLTVAHQYIEQLDPKIKDAVFGNVGTMVVHRVAPENAEIFAKTFEPVFAPSDMLKLENLNCYIKMLVNGMPAKPFNSKTPLPPRGDMTLGEKIKELSYIKYGRPRAEVEEEILARYRKTQPVDMV